MALQAPRSNLTRNILVITGNKIASSGKALLAMTEKYFVKNQGDPCEVALVTLLFLIRFPGHALANFRPELFGFLRAFTLRLVSESAEAIREQHGEQGFHDIT
jgi:hypothetical protein